MKAISKQILLACVLSATTNSQVLFAAGPAPVNLLSTAHFTILAGATITYPGSGTINGDIGAYPIAGAAILIPSSRVNGIVYACDATYALGASVVDAALLLAAMNDLTVAYNDAAGRTPVPTGPFLNPGAGNIGGLNLAPGLYKFTTSASIAGADVTLTGGPDDVWIFQIGTTLDVEAGVNRTVILAGGAQARNVFWQVGSSATIGTYAVFKGTIMADQAIIMDVGSTMEGRALAFSAGVTFSGSGGSLPNNGPLDIVSEHGVGQLPVGVYTNMYGVTLTNSITGVDTLGGTQYVATGWNMTGNDPPSGSGTNMVMVQTNSAVLTWLWNTNYALNVSSDTNGTLIGSTNGWYLAGSSVTVTAAPNPGCIFLGWTGNVTGSTNAVVQTMTMDQARTVMANFGATGPAGTNVVILTIVSQYGAGMPPVGVHSNIVGATLTNSIPGIVTDGGTQYVCTGWTMTGNDPISGGTNSMFMTQTNHAVLTWLWQTNYQLTVVSSNGTVTGGSNGFYAAGTVLPLTGTPATNYVFAYWIVDGVNSGANLPLNVTMNGAHTVAAVYEAHFGNLSWFADIHMAWTTNYARGSLYATVTISNRQSLAKVMLAPVWFEIPTNTSINRLRNPTGVDTNTGNGYLDVSTDFSNQVSLVGNHDYALNPGEVVTLSPMEIWGYQVPTGMVVAVLADPTVQTHYSGASDTNLAFTGPIRLSADGKSVVWDAQSNWMYTVECANTLQAGSNSFQTVATGLRGCGALAVCASSSQITTLAIGNGDSGGSVFYRVKASK